MDLIEVQKNWNHFGQVDPLWAILTHPDKINNKWDVGDFFKTGAEEIDHIFQHLSSFGVPKNKRSALDFGCGVGRLTQALCRYFDRCCGIDIAPSMIRLAAQYNTFGEKCEYVLNESEGLPAFENDSRDFIFASLVLQHMRPDFSKSYILEFLRILSPGGALIFQLPAELRPPSRQSEILYGIMPDSGFQASIQPHQVCHTAAPGSQLEVQATVRNLSPCVWTPSEVSPTYPIQFGNHWLSGEGEVITLDDARESLTQELKPLESADFRLVVTCPVKPGGYVLELDMVQESIAWFANKGSETSKVQVIIEANLGADARATTPAAHPIGVVSLRANGATMEMYGVPKDEVLATIASGNGEVLKVVPDLSAGPQWNSHIYFVTKSK